MPKFNENDDILFVWVDIWHVSCTKCMFQCELNVLMIWATCELNRDQFNGDNLVDIDAKKDIRIIQ